MLGKCSINVSYPMSESAGIDSLGQEQSYSWGFLRRKNQPLAPQGLLSVFLYLAWPNMCLWALTVPWFLFINSFFLQAYEGLASLEPNLSTNLPQRTQSDTPLTVEKKSEKWKSFSRVWLFATPWTIQPMKFSQNTGVGSLSLLQGIFPT